MNAVEQQREKWIGFIRRELLDIGIERSNEELWNTIYFFSGCDMEIANAMVLEVAHNGKTFRLFAQTLREPVPAVKDESATIWFMVSAAVAWAAFFFGYFLGVSL